MEEHIYLRTRGKWIDLGPASKVDVQDDLADGVPWKKDTPGMSC